MEDIRLIVDLVVALGVALGGGLAARALGMPVIVGYVLAGIVVGPNSPGISANLDRVELMANVGVAFLMFAVGVEFSLNQLMSVRRVALTTAAVQFPLSFLLGWLVGTAIGWDLQASLLLGLVFLPASSIVMIKLTLGRGETATPYARSALGLGILQDISMVPLLALLPLLQPGAENPWGTLLRSVGVGLASLVLAFVVGTRVVPRAFHLVARTGSRELFLLTIVVIALGTAYLSHEAELSFALGAFLAGLIVSESEFDVHVLAEIIPLRDLFSTLFFVSLGMLLQPRLFVDHPVLLGGVVLVLVVGKALAAGLGFLLSGLVPDVAARAGLLTAQIGEFSFVLAGIALTDHIIDQPQYSLILGIALASILVSPFALSFSPVAARLAAHVPGVSERSLALVDQEASYETMRRHVIICGYGRVGKALAEVLSRRGLAYVVIEMNPAIVAELQRTGVAAIYGDSAAEPVLHRAGAEHARSIAVTVPNVVAGAQTVRVARRMNASVDIVARAARVAELQGLHEAGANEVVQPEFEAGLEFVRHVLRRQGVSSREVLSLLGRRRALFYSTSEPETVFQEDA